MCKNNCVVVAAVLYCIKFNVVVVVVVFAAAAAAALVVVVSSDGEGGAWREGVGNERTGIQKSIPFIYLDDRNLYC